MNCCKQHSLCSWWPQCTPMGERVLKLLLWKSSSNRKCKYQILGTCKLLQQLCSIGLWNDRCTERWSSNWPWISACSLWHSSGWVLDFLNSLPQQPQEFSGFNTGYRLWIGEVLKAPMAKCSLWWCTKFSRTICCWTIYYAAIIWYRANRTSLSAPHSQLDSPHKMCSAFRHLALRYLIWGMKDNLALEMRPHNFIFLTTYMGSRSRKSQVHSAQLANMHVDWLGFWKIAIPS